MAPTNSSPPSDTDLRRSARPVRYDVSPDVSWFPILTWGQVSADLMAGFSAGPGFGHNYSTDFVSGWASVVPPNGWSATDTRELEDHLRFAIEAESSA